MRFNEKSSHDLRKLQRREKIAVTILFFCVSVSVLTTLGIVMILVKEALAFFQDISLMSFVTDSKWTPLFVPRHFGISPLLSGTLMVTLLSIAMALPIGLGSAIFMSEFAPLAWQKIMKPCLELLAGIPTVVYGYFALMHVTPLIKRIVPQIQVFNALSASIVLAIMLIPMISSISQEAMRSIPDQLRAAALSLGSTKFEVAMHVVLPAARSGVMASLILAMSRAIGETMIVTLAAGMTPKLTANPLESVQTMTAYIVQVSLGDTPYGSLEYKSIFAVGLVLFLLTLALNIMGRWILNRREVYR